MSWFSASELPATLAFARARELGLLSPDVLVRDHLPESAGGGRDTITVRPLCEMRTRG
ncbi:hypothetical protein [Streptomyces sp. NPDC007205]|uniref:hypothetical protein n=1 Tax=Streptomyces sp. NPDC007205 TaxID=3154316 RepID=UPI0033E73287